MRLLRQNQHNPMSQHEQVITLVAALAHQMQEVPLQHIEKYRRDLINYIVAQAPYICQEIDQHEKLSEETKQEIIEHAKTFLQLKKETNFK